MVSLETRGVFLDPEVIDLAKDPNGREDKNGHGKWCLRELLYKELKSIVERPKWVGVPIVHG